MSIRNWSVDAELHNGVHAKCYRHDPYRVRGKVFYFQDSDLAPTMESPPEGTRHTNLWGRVSFVPYPAYGFNVPTPAVEDESTLVRTFIGQLPYFVTDMQLAWLCHTFGGGAAVMYPERIMKRQPSGERLPTGCIHAYATPEAVEAMAAGMHKRMLVDDTGVWHAQTHEEFEVLKSYIGVMKVNKSARVPNRPYDSVVVQLAVSTFVPVVPMPLTELPAERAKRGAKGRRAGATPPPEGHQVAPSASTTPDATTPRAGMSPSWVATPPPPPYAMAVADQFISGSYY